MINARSDLAALNESSSDLSEKVDSVLPQSIGHFWDGRWNAPASSWLGISMNPSTGRKLADVLMGSKTEVDLAVEAASSAAGTWMKTSPLERSRLLREAAARIRNNALELALLDAADCGNPVNAMTKDAEIAAAQLDYFAGLVLELKGETVPTGDGSLNYTVREPLGVVGRIFAFNHPFMFAAGKIAAPLASGNTDVLKPPEQAPLSTIRLMELLQDLFPPGVLNCVIGGHDAGEALATHPKVAAVALIGSVAAGQAVQRSAASTLKKTLLELGGKNAMIIYPDADFPRRSMAPFGA